MTQAYYTSPADVAALTKVRSSDINTIDAAVEAAFEKLPTEDNIKRGTINYAADTGVADAYLVALPNTPSGYVDGLLVAFKPTNTNTGAATINVNSLGVKSIKKTDGTALAAGDLNAGVPVDIRYSTTTGFFHLAPNSNASAVAAAASAAAAASSASSASSSASGASASASTATTQANTATTQASAAATSASSAESSASAATTQANNAATSATNAANSASSASASASTATTQATNASASASTATAQASNASTSAAAAAAALDSLDDRWLGAKSSDPTTDNDGNPLQEGANYFNTAIKRLKYYDGAQWKVAFGDAIDVDFLPAGIGSVTRPVQAKLREWVSVADKGAAGTGLVDESSAFTNAATSANVVIVPSGTYRLDSNVAASGAHFLVYGTLTGAGKLVGALVTRFGQNVMAVGRNSDNAGASYQGLQIGGGDAQYGSDGMGSAPDGHASWLRFQPSKNESAVELMIYSTAAQGIATATNGTNQLTRVSGTAFSASWVGKKIYFGEARYTVATVPDADHLTVTQVGGGAVSFASTFNETFHVAYISGTGTCNVIGSTVTRVSGDPFIAFVSSPFVFKINGIARTVSSFTDTSTYVLSAAPGDVTGATYTFETDINDQITTLRVQKLLGSNEENLSIFARYDGYHLRSFYAGSGKVRPIFIGNDNYTQIAAYANGDLTLGGQYATDAIRILAPSGTVANRLETQAAGAGFRANLRVRGTDSNPGLNIDLQGTGDFLITGGSFARSLFGATGSSGATAYVNADAGTAVATVSAKGSATNAELAVTSKGTSAVSVNTGGGKQAQFINVASTVNYLEFSGSATGGSTTMRVRGSDTNPGLNLDLQGTGAFVITGGSFARSLFKVTGNASADTYASLDANIGFTALAANSSLSNADVRVLPKGAGLFWIGTTSAPASVPGNFAANRSLAIKDNSGTTYYIPLMAATW